MKQTIVDPPGGWRFGFPALLQDDYEQQLRDAGYPEKDIKLALEHSRYWEEEVEMKVIEVRYNKHYPFFGLIGNPVEHKQHPNQQKGIDKYVKVINFDTGQECFKKLYKNTKGIYFKHTGYSSMYIDEFKEFASVIPFQVIFD